METQVKGYEQNHETSLFYSRQHACCQRESSFSVSDYGVNNVSTVNIR